MSYHRILGDYLADHLIYLSLSYSFWFSLNSSYEHDFHLSKQLGTSQPAGCYIASLCLLVMPPSCPAPLIVVAPLCATAAATATAKLLPPLHCRAASTTTNAAAAAALPRSCHQRLVVSLPQPPLSLPPLLSCRQAAADVALSRCRNCHCRRAAATTLRLLRCAPPPRFALPPPPLTLPPPPRCCQAVFNFALSHCHHHCAASKLMPISRCCAVATPAVAVLLPLRCCRHAVHCYRHCAAAKMPPPLHCCAAAAAMPSFVGWLLRCCLPSDFVIACRHATVDALFACCFCR